MGHLDLIQNEPLSKTNRPRPNTKGCYNNEHVIIWLSDTEHIEFNWGEYFVIGTAAYWINQATQYNSINTFSFGESLAEEVIFCLLGGHGIPAEIGNIYFKILKEHNVFSSKHPLKADDIKAIIGQPVYLDNKVKPIRYRFVNQKSKSIALALEFLRNNIPPTNPLELREWLQKMSGIGPKTASWIVRNQYCSNDVAIIDIHIHKAGLTAGFFDRKWKLPKDYYLFEKAFIEYSKLGGVKSSILDMCIWDQMRRFGTSARNLLFDV